MPLDNTLAAIVPVLSRMALLIALPLLAWLGVISQRYLRGKINVASSFQ
jgi:hypothetical protein